jgi:hypothetical protein
MKPKSERTELHNNYINGFFKTNLNNGEQSNFESTNNSLLNNHPGLLLNKKIVKISNDNMTAKNNSVELKNNIILDKDFNNNKNEWIKNRLKITKNMQEKKIIYRLEPDNGNHLNNNINNNINTLSAYKDSGFYVIYKYINEKNNYDKEIKAKIKWNMLSNHFKIYDCNNNIIEEIIYNFNFKRMNGPTKFQILIPLMNKNIMNGMEKGGNRIYVNRMENKLPEYNSIYKSYVLNFINRKVIPNEKNVQIIYSDLKEDKNNILLQFAQVENDEYALDYKYPFNNITAFALALTNLSSRMFYE